MTEFKVGDRIIMVENSDAAKKGMIGTIVEIDGSVTVDFDLRFSGGHDCEGASKEGCGQYTYGKRRFKLLSWKEVLKQ